MCDIRVFALTKQKGCEKLFKPTMHLQGYKRIPEPLSYNLPPALTYQVSVPQDPQRNPPMTTSFSLFICPHLPSRITPSLSRLPQPFSQDRSHGTGTLLVVCSFTCSGWSAQALGQVAVFVFISESPEQKLSYSSLSHCTSL